MYFGLNLGLERVQKNAFRNILQDKYISYEQALSDLKIKTKFSRREKLLLKFGEKSAVLPQTRNLFQLKINNQVIRTRNQEKYEILHAHTSRLMNSTVPHIQRILNTEEIESN